MSLIDDELDDVTLWSSTDIGGDDLGVDGIEWSLTDIGGDDRGLEGNERSSADNERSVCISFNMVHQVQEYE